MYEIKKFRFVLSLRVQGLIERSEGEREYIYIYRMSSTTTTRTEYDPEQWLSLREAAKVTHKSERPYGENFYISPYLTCKECNCCSFVNDGPLRMRIQQLQISSMNYLNEDMPPCPRCGSSHAYVLGTHDFSSQIRESRDALAGDRRERARAAAMIQNIMRSYHIRMKYRRFKRKERETKNRRSNAVTKIQSLYRGYHGRFRFNVFKSLRRIRDTHVIVLERALREDFGDHKKVFWYKRKTERRILFQDFEVYVRRTGGRPPKHKVASNIHTIRERVHILECEYATRIESRWRGVLGRRFSWKYRQLQARRLERLTTAALKIQRCALAWYDSMRFSLKHDFADLSNDVHTHKHTGLVELQQDMLEIKDEQNRVMRHIYASVEREKEIKLIVTGNGGHFCCIRKREQRK
jgi:hypothetical protein